MSRRPRRHHPAAGPLLLVLAALLGVAGSPAAATAVAGASSAVAVPESPTRTTPTPTRSREPAPEASPGDDRARDDEPAAAVEVRVTEVSPQVVRASDPLVVRATVRNTGDDTLESPRVALRINRFLQSTRSSLDEWVEQDLDDTAGTQIDVTPLPGPLAPGQSVDVELGVDAGALGLSTAGAAWGPRGVSVEVTDGGRREGILRTFVLWLPTDEPVTPTRLSVLVPLTGGPVDPTATAPPGDPEVPAGDTVEDGTTEDGTTEDGTGADGAGADSAAPDDARPVQLPADDVVDRLDAVLDVTADERRVSWAVDPALLAAARTAPAGAPARLWADDLTVAATGRDVLTLPAHDADLAALAHGGGADLAAQAVTAAAAAVDPVLGSPPRTDVAWPASGEPDAATVSLAARTGASAVVLGGGALAPDGLSYTPTGRGTVTTTEGRVAALVSDPVLTRQLTAPAEATPAAAVQRVLAETAVITRERPSELRHLLVAADRGWEPDVAAASAQLAALAAAPWVDLAPLTALLGAADPAVDRAPLPDLQVGDGEIRPGEVTAMVRARAELAAFATVVPDPPQLLVGADDAVLAPTAVAWREDPVQRSAVVDAVVDELAARRSGVSVVPGSTPLLISEAGLFPLALRNDLPQEATVQVAVQPENPLLVINEAQTVVIPAASEMQVRVPFHAVGSGDVMVSVALLAPDGTALGAPQEFTVRVRADWENVGTGVVAGLLGLALVVGIVRTIRRGQTAKRGAGSTPVEDIARLPEHQP